MSSSTIRGSISPDQYALGLDIGASSIGWALVALAPDGEPRGMIACGTRIFEAGVEGTLEGGRDTPRGVARRLARQQRRQTARRAQRKRRVYRALVAAGLLPDIPVVNHAGIDAAIRDLDAALRRQWIAPGDHRGQLVFPYQLRAAAAERQLDGASLGRAVYHLAQRRGFLSNRKTRAREDEDGVVKKGISDLEAEMTAAGRRTLGAYLASLDPRQCRIRKRYTHRAMFEVEFDAIRAANQWVSNDAWNAIRKAMFRQRKLKSSAHLIGRCECVPRARKAPMWHPLFQRFRILDQIANLRVRMPSEATWRTLNPEERGPLLDHLKLTAKVTPAGVKRVLKLKGAELSIESEGAGALVGDRTAAAMRNAFGDGWDSMSQVDQMAALLDVHSFEKADALRRRGATRWKLDPASATALSEVQLEPSYASLSTQAIERLLPHMEEGLNARQAMDIAFPGRFAVSVPEAELPPVSKAMPELRNPAVSRALTETRRIVNRVVERWGLPAVVRLELARDLKRSRMQRERIAKENRAQEKVREEALKRVLAEGKIANPKRSDVEKLLLAEECDFTCPYTGRRFGMADLFGPHPSVDVEHIIPFSRSLDDSFSNKTLCFVDENRNIKRNRTPFEAYGRDRARWDEIMARANRFRGARAKGKVERFAMEEAGPEILEEFADRQLNDTRFASRMAALYVARLYGGTDDASGKRRVQASTGAVTARLRQAWKMGFVLHDDGAKNRNDHRNHALDAIAIALSTPGTVKRMADAAKRGSDAGRDGRLLEFSEPWPGFLEDVREAIQNIIASHRPDRRIAGPLHEETNYTRPLSAGNRTLHRTRKSIEDLSAKDIPLITDPGIRTVVAGAIADGSRDLSASTKQPLANPARPDRIRHLRIEGSRSPVELSTRKGRRWVAPASNHHMAIFELEDGNGKARWVTEVVTRLEAHRRHRAGEPIIRRDRGDGSRFLFSLRSGDTIRLNGDEGQPQFVVIRSVSGTAVEALAANDARPAQEVRAAGAAGGRIKLSASSLQKRGAQRVDVSPIGEVTLGRD